MSVTHEQAEFDIDKSPLIAQHRAADGHWQMVHLHTYLGNGKWRGLDEECSNEIIVDESDCKLTLSDFRFWHQDCETDQTDADKAEEARIMKGSDDEGRRMVLRRSIVRKVH